MPAPSKFAVVNDIGLKVHRTVRTSFEAFGETWKFDCQNQSAANIAKSCLTYYKAMWEHPHIDPLNVSDVVIDVGAHMGFFSIPVNSQVSRMVSLEPAPANFELLRRNINLNNTHNIWAIQNAVSDRHGPIPFHLGVRGTTGHSATNRKQGGVDIQVQAVTISYLVQSYSPTVLKLDCEGAEWLVLTKDNAQYLQSFRIIIAELHKVKQHSLLDVKRVLKRSGFKIEAQSNSWFTKLVAYK